MVSISLPVKNIRLPVVPSCVVYSSGIAPGGPGARLGHAGLDGALVNAPFELLEGHEHTDVPGGEADERGHEPGG